MNHPHPTTPTPAALTLPVFQQALALHQQGLLTQARILYTQVLADNPAHFDALHLSGVIALQSGQASEALQWIDQALQVNPQVAAALANKGLALQHLQRLDEAVLICDQALAIDPQCTEALSNRGLALHGLRRMKQALASFDHVLAIRPLDAETHFNRANVLKDLQRLEEAVASYDQTISLQAHHAQALNNRGIALKDLRQNNEALTSFQRAIAIQPHYAEAFYNQGNALLNMNRLEEAVLSYDQAIGLQDQHAPALNNRGNALKELGRLAEAVASFQKATAIQPDHPEAFNNLGNTLRDLQRLDEALRCYDQSIALQPNNAAAHNNRGIALKEQKRLEEALQSFDRAIERDPSFADAHNNRGNALLDLQRHAQALASFDQCIALNPQHADAFNNRGNALSELQRAEQALQSYGQALQINPRDANALNNCGNALLGLKRTQEALVCYEKALAIQPDYVYLLGMKMQLCMQHCQWQQLSQDLQTLQAAINAGQKSVMPFPFLGLMDDPALQRKVSQIYIRDKLSEAPLLDDFQNRDPSQKIRIGYYSSDFHNHATAHLMVELLASHDRQKFEIWGFSFGPDRPDAMRQRLRQTFDQFIDVQAHSDREVAQLSRTMGVDIAVDLKGLTGDARAGMFVQRCAPIQVNYLGYPGTMDSPCIDYIVADKVLIPTESQVHYAEKVVYLPHSYQVNDSKRPIADKVFTRQEVGLPESGFVFCCFNNNYKIQPQTFDIWMRLLHKVAGSVLWLFEDNPTAAKNLQQEAKNRGIDPSRLVFAQRMHLPEHLARHRLADLFLDTLPVNAHTTASDALWAGLPVLTLIGQSFAARVAASLLHAMDLPELISHTEIEYESKALALATQPQLLKDLKLKIERVRPTTSLFKGCLLALHLEAAYLAMLERHQSGQAPEHLVIQP